MFPADRSSENVAQFKSLRTTVRDNNLVQQEITRRLNSGNACHCSVQNILSSCLLSKSIKIQIYKTIILPMLLYGRETWYLTFRAEHRMRVKNAVFWDVAPCRSCVNARSTRRHIPEDGIVHSHRRENLKSNIDWWCLRTGCWGEYLNRWEMKWRETGESRVIRTFTTCTILQV
jgi:hypothetical protein